jgi:hypothetical protein
MGVNMMFHYVSSLLMAAEPEYLKARMSASSQPTRMTKVTIHGLPPAQLSTFSTSTSTADIRPSCKSLSTPSYPSVAVDAPVHFRRTLPKQETSSPRIPPFFGGQAVENKANPNAMLKFHECR